jgi:hypothetical protein
MVCCGINSDAENAGDVRAVNKIRAIRSPGSLEHLGDMLGDCIPAYVQFKADLYIRISCRDKPQDTQVSGGKANEAIRVVPVRMRTARTSRCHDHSP